MQGQILGGRYYIIHHLGGGGFGQTYLAEDRQLPGNPHCVVKQLKPQSNDPATLQVARRLFNTEAEVLYILGNHPQIPRLLAHFEEAQEFYLVQEFIEGHDLGEELTPGKPMSESWVIILLQEILEVLAFVHQQNVIHRDIKPNNIRRRLDGKIVLIDFGAVKQIRTQVLNSQGMTNFTVGIGTPGYMPNEQANCKPKFSSDVYAVGMLGIQALTGILPDQLLEDLVTGEIVWRDKVQVSSELSDVLDKMVRYDFRQRYPSAIEVLQALKDLMNPITSAVPSPSRKTLSFSRSQSRNSKLSPWKVLTGLGIAAVSAAVLNLPRLMSLPPDKSASQQSETSTLLKSEPMKTPSTIDSSITSPPESPQVLPSPKSIPSNPLNETNTVPQSSFYFVADSAFLTASDAEQKVNKLKRAGYSQVGKFWIPDYPNLSGKPLFEVYSAKFSDRQSCANFLMTYSQQNPNAYCAFASPDKNASADRFYASSQKQVSTSSNSITTNTNQISSFYFVATSAIRKASEAKQKVKNLKKAGYSQAGKFWIPDYPNLSGKPFFVVYPAQFSDRQSCAAFLRTYRQQNPDSYCAFASQDRNANPDRF